MLDTKFQGSKFFGSGEEDFLRVFAIYGHSGLFDQQIKTIRTNFHFLNPEG